MNHGFYIYTWRGERIDNIEKWAKDRNEKMVDITWERKEFNLYGDAKKVITLYRVKESMPESFWNTLRITEDMGKPVKVRKRNPKLSRAKEIGGLV